MAPSEPSDSLRVEVVKHVVEARVRAQQAGKAAGLGVVDLTKLVTAVSELARNMVVHAGGGQCSFQILHEGRRKGVRVHFEDQGPGIASLDLALTDGFSTAGSLGLGLPGARRLADEFELSSEPGKGTRVTITKWGR